MKQITEDYVSFETAKLLKEKGFKEITQGYINADKEVYMLPFQQGVYELGKKQYPYPTHQMALKWLREVHKLHIKIGFLDKGINGQYYYYYFAIDSTDGTRKDYCQSAFEKGFDTNEEAVEAAILYVLKNLI